MLVDRWEDKRLLKILDLGSQSHGQPRETYIFILMLTSKGKRPESTERSKGRKHPKQGGEAALNLGTNLLNGTQLTESLPDTRHLKKITTSDPQNSPLGPLLAIPVWGRKEQRKTVQAQRGETDVFFLPPPTTSQLLSYREIPRTRHTYDFWEENNPQGNSLQI